MGGTERSGHQGSGLLVEPFSFIGFGSNGFFVNASADFTLRTILPSAFFNFGVPYARTVTLTLNITGTGANRVVLRIRGRDQFGEVQSEILDTLAQTVIALYKIESRFVYAQITSIETLTGTSTASAATWSFGYHGTATGNDVNGVLHAGTIFWGIPFKTQGTRFDSNPATVGWRCDEGDIVLSMGSVIPSAGVWTVDGSSFGDDPRDLRFDSTRNAIRWAANHFDWAAIAVKMDFLIRRPAGT